MNVVARVFVAGLALASISAPAEAMPVARIGVAPAANVETVAYRRHHAHYYRGHRVYRRYHYGYNPGAAFLGAAAGLIGAGVAASQAPYYYGYPYGYYGYPYGYGYGYPW